MRSMFKACKMGIRPVMAAMLAAVAACVPNGDTGGGGPDPIDRPDAQPSHPDRRSCLAGQPPCESNTECANFGDFGGQVCAELCTLSSDCGGDLVCIPDGNGQGVCATPEWGGVAGIYPEELCRDENSCNVHWDDNTNGCQAYLNACLGGLTESRVQQWTQAVHDCLTNNSDSCNSAFYCLDQVPWC